MSFFKDEQGNASSARALLWLWSVFTALLIIGVVTDVLNDPGQAVWSLIGGVFLALIAWAGGPRAMQYLGPQVAGFAKSIGDARDGREPSKHDNHRDD